MDAVAAPTRPVEVRARQRRWLPPVMLAVALATGVFVGWGLAANDESETPADRSAEAGFLRDMVTHHAQAVEMALIVRDRTENPTVGFLATDIALTQQSQIGTMLGWLDLWDLPPTGRDPAMTWMGHPTTGRMPGMAAPEEIAALSTLPAGEADARFLRLMIVHHRAGVEMAQAALDRIEGAEVARFARSVVSAQAGEIETMEAMLRAGGQDLAPPAASPTSHPDHAGG